MSNIYDPQNGTYMTMNKNNNVFGAPEMEPRIPVVTRNITINEAIEMDNKNNKNNNTKTNNTKPANKRANIPPLAQEGGKRKTRKQKRKAKKSRKHSRRH